MAFLNFWRKEDNVLKAFFAWASLLVSDEDCILINLLPTQGYFYFTFPLKHGDRPRRSAALPEGKKVRFIVSADQRMESISGSWISIYSSPYLTIFENKHSSLEIPPLRWKLDKKEKKKALEIARKALQENLCNNSFLTQEYFDALPPQFYVKTDLAVALWVNGSLRGSAVFEGSSLGEGIAKAAIRASRDKRFKPPSCDELPTIRIEVTVIQNLRIPITDTELKENILDTQKGYCYEEGKRKGWYLPEVFNVRKFSDFEEFISMLAKEKANIEGKPSISSVLHFEVDDFIESDDHVSAISLKGPVPAAIERGEMKNVAERAADWLVAIQEPDGNFPAIFDPISCRVIRQIDWPRLAFSAWTLAEICHVFPKEKGYKEAAEMACSYLSKYLFEMKYEISNLSLTFAYFGNLCLSLGKEAEALEVYSKIDISQAQFEPILFSQVASLLKRLSKYDSSKEKEYFRLTSYLKSEFEKRLSKESLSLAAWAELANSFIDLDPAFSKRVCDWLISFQSPDGSFPSSSTIRFSYTRGTGKIFEVLSLMPDQYAEALKNVLAWLSSMQYDEDSLFFVSNYSKAMVKGGFRHDYLNPESWIDAAGHVVLGSARMLSRKI